MYKKLLITTAIAAISSNVVADTAFDKAFKVHIKVMQSMSTDITFVSVNDIINNKRIKTDKNAAFIANAIKNDLIINEEQQKNGYVKMDEPRAKELMEIKNIVSYQQKKFRDDIIGTESTGMRKSIDELKLAYTFLGVPASEVSYNIGFAPMGSYRQIKNGDESDGWDSVGQFFENKSIGSCTYTEQNRKMSHGYVQLVKELTTNDINDKPTSIMVDGNEDSGFLYTVRWYDATFNHALECANKDFSQQLRASTIELAKKIDTQS